MKFGKRAPRLDYRTLKLRRYLAPTLPTPPQAYNVLPRILANLRPTAASILFPMDGNDQYGDCTIAALAHADTVYQAMLKRESILTQQAVTDLYFQLSGGQDTGLDELTVLNYWAQNKVGSDQITAYASIDPKNIPLVKLAIYLFGGVYLGFQVQQNAIGDFDNHVQWTPGPLTQDGHAVYAVGYDAKEVTVLTWGSTQQGTWGWWMECVDECYAILPPEAAAPGFTPGLNIMQLQSDLAAIRQA